MTHTLASDYDPVAPAVQADPYPFYAALRDTSPVCFVASLNGFAVSRYADARRVMHDNLTFSSEAMAALVARPAQDGSPISIIGTDGQTHTRLRLIVNRGFTPKRIAHLEERVRDTARAFVADLVARGEGDLQAGLAVPLPTVVIAELLGVAPEQRDDFRRWSEDMVRGVFEPLSPGEQADIVRSGDQMGDWLDSVIEARAGRIGNDLISVLLQAEAEGGALTHDELRVFVFTLLVAGSITTAYLIGTAADVLAHDPELLRSVQADPSRLGPIVEETLRYDAPVQVMFRTATRDVELAGAAIPRGATVAALLGSANRDERAFAGPDRFDPSRVGSEHLAFGHGAHFCLGAALARLEARVVLDELVSAAPRLELAGEVERVSSMVFRGPTRLPLRFS